MTPPPESMRRKDQPTYQSHVAGRAFLALRKQARAHGRTTAEYLRLYALEGFLLRLANSPHRSKFVLKGGVLLAAHELRRPTADVDFAAIQLSNEVESVRQVVAEIASTVLPAERYRTASRPGQHAMARLRRHLPAHCPSCLPRAGHALGATCSGGPSPR